MRASKASVLLLGIGGGLRERHPMGLLHEYFFLLRVLPSSENNRKGKGNCKKQTYCPRPIIAWIFHHFHQARIEETPRAHITATGTARITIAIHKIFSAIITSLLFLPLHAR